MRIFQGRQAEQIEENVGYLEVTLGLRHGKGPVEERLALILSETLRRTRTSSLMARELHQWKRTGREVAVNLTKLVEMSVKATAEERKEPRVGPYSNG